MFPSDCKNPWFYYLTILDFKADLIQNPIKYKLFLRDSLLKYKTVIVTSSNFPLQIEQTSIVKITLHIIKIIWKTQ